MIVWASINAATALFTALVIIFMTARYREDLSALEHVGWSAAATGLVLRIGPIIGTKILGVSSPFDDWSVTFLHVGLAVAAYGWLRRKRYRPAHG